MTRKVHYHGKWNPHQDVVCWIHLARAQERGPLFWQTRSHAINDHDSVPADCIEQVACGRNLKSDTLHAWASSEDRSQECLEMEANSSNGSSKIHKEAAGCRLRSTPKANQLARQTQEVHGHPLWRKSMILKLNSQVKEHPQDALLEDQGRMTRNSRFNGQAQN